MGKSVQGSIEAREGGWTKEMGRRRSGEEQVREGSGSGGDDGEERGYTLAMLLLGNRVCVRDSDLVLVVAQRADTL